MEAEVRYCMTSDGVRIAYAVAGSGPPLVGMSEPLASHVQLGWSHPILGRIAREHVRHNTFVTFDPRGSGLSDRVLPRTQDDWLLDAEAVVERVGLQEFGLVAVQLGTPTAVTFAAKHADRVTRVVLTDGFARWRDMLATPQSQAVLAAVKLDWVFATEAIGSAVFGSGREESSIHGAFIRAASNPENYILAESVAAWDVSDLARSISAPTLVLKHTGIHFVTMEMSQDLAARIPNARFAVIDGTWADDPEGFARRVAAFINDESQVAGRAPVSTSGMTAILFADIADSTALTERLGDATFRAKARELDGALRGVIREHAGTAIEGKLLGDGVLAVFTSARQAIEAALACGTAGNREGLPLHLGLHAGDVIREDNNVYGGAVNIAARISGLSAAGEVLVSETVRSLARTSAGVRFEDRGEQALKGVGEPVRVWAIVED